MNSGIYITFYIEQESWRDSGPGEALIAVIANQKFWKKWNTFDHAEQVEKSKIPIFLYMTPQGLRKVSVGQNLHKHDFPKIEDYEKRIFWKFVNLIDT